MHAENFRWLLCKMVKITTDNSKWCIFKHKFNKKTTCRVENSFQFFVLPYFQGTKVSEAFHYEFSTSWTILTIAQKKIPNFSSQFALMSLLERSCDKEHLAKKIFDLSMTCFISICLPCFTWCLVCWKKK